MLTIKSEKKTRVAVVILLFIVISLLGMSKSFAFDEIDILNGEEENQEPAMVPVVTMDTIWDDVVKDNDDGITQVEEILPEAGEGIAEEYYDIDGIIAGDYEETKDLNEVIRESKLPDIREVSEKLYVSTLLNVRADPSTDSQVVDKLHKTERVKVTGYTEDGEWARVETDEGIEAFVAKEYLTPDKITYEEKTYNKKYSNKGSSKKILSSGANKETYYNLDMSRVISNARKKGIGGEYWVRSDGCKMLGDYIMVAANLDTHPRGSLVETSLGTGIVVDTGTFAYSNPNQIDIATTW